MYEKLKKVQETQAFAWLCKILGDKGNNNKQFLRLWNVQYAETEASRYALFFIESLGGIMPKF